MREHALEGSWDWLEWAAGLPSKPVPVPLGSAAITVFSGRCILTGLTVTNSAASGGTLIVHDGLDTNGNPAVRLGIGANSTGGYNAPVRGILMELGVTVNPNTLTLQGSVYVVPLWHYGETAPGE